MLVSSSVILGISEIIAVFIDFVILFISKNMQLTRLVKSSFIRYQKVR